MLPELTEWQDLITHHQSIANESMQRWFDDNPKRAQVFSLQVGDLFLDYSKNRITADTLTLFEKLASAAGLSHKIQQLFEGSPLNFTEDRAVLHTALRNLSEKPVYVNQQDVMPEIMATLTKLQHFSDQVRQKKWLGATGKPIQTIVNVGIGGSHLGPQMATHALNDFAMPGMTCHFVSKIDGTDLDALLKQIDPEVSLFIISSKTFTTIETMTNAKTIRQWLADKLGTAQLSQHFVAVTTAIAKAEAFGIPAQQIFPIWNWVGGRYSVWSAIGLPLIIMMGMENFRDFLKGAEGMDDHFREAPLLKNMPVLLAFLGIWYINFFQATSHAVVPYSHHLHYFRAYLQQLDMESNGKSISHQGSVINYLTGPIVWGDHGSDGQHAYLQHIHQSPHLIPVDFILVGQTHHDLQDHQDILVASALSQAKALMRGKSVEEAHAELKAQGCDEANAKLLAIHKSLPGNRPSNVLFLKKMTPFNLGALLALYEHKVFVQGCIWHINSFDQWGVELGKQLLPEILHDLTHANEDLHHDASTINLIHHYKKLRTKSCENHS